MSLEYIFVNNKKPNKTIIFLHGLGGHLTNHFEFQEKIKTHNYYAFTFPGHDGKNVFFNDLNLFCFRDLILKFIEEKKLKDIILIGHSMGGAISSLIAKEIPDLIKKIILVAPYNRSAYSILGKLKNYQLSKFYNKRIIRFFFKKFERINFFGMHFKTYKRYEPLSTNSLLSQLFLTRTGINKLETIMLTQKADMTFESVGNILLSVAYLGYQLANPKTIYKVDRSYKKWANKISALLILGEHDIVLDSNYNKKYLSSIIKDLKVVILPNTGHLPFIDNYTDYEKAILNFLEDKK